MNRNTEATELIGQAAQRASVERGTSVLRSIAAAHAAPAGTFVTITDPAHVAEQTQGCPLVVKDNIRVAGFATTAATPALQSMVSDCDAAAVARLRAGGMVVIGTSNLHELALGVTSSHGLAGAVTHPLLPGRVTGGSSGGTAAAIAAGVCAHGLGSDTGGSTRIPAAFTGIWGYRPSTGRYPASGSVSISYLRDTIGPMAADLPSLRHLDRLLALRYRFASSPAHVRVGVDRTDTDRCAPEVSDAYHQLLRLLRADPTITVIEIDCAELDQTAAVCEPRLGVHELAPSLKRYLRDTPGAPSLQRVLEQVTDQHVAQLIEHSISAVAAGVWSAEWQELLHECARIRARYLALFSEHRLHAMLRPAVPILPPILAAVVAGDLRDRDRLFTEVTSFTRLAPLVGSPSLSMPIEHLIAPTAPLRGIGVLLEGLPGCDEALLAIAEAIAASTQAA